MKIKIILLNFVLILSTSIKSGVSIDTPVETPHGSKEISLLKAGDEVISLNSDFSKSPRPIITLEELEIDSYIEITTEDDITIRVSPDQKFFIPHKWIQADQLSLSDVLLRKDNTLIRIKSICAKQEKIKLHFITVEGHRNFLATKNGILVHNGPISGAVGYWIAKTLCYGTAAAAIGTLTTATTGVTGAAIGTIVTAATLNVPPAVSLTAGAIAGASLATEAVTATAAVTTCAGGVTQAIAAIETFASAVGWLCSLLPLP